jgi:hypothetical protein
MMSNNKKIKKRATCKIWSVIRFLKARNMKPADLHCQLCEVYGEHAMSDSVVRRWVRRENIYDDLQSGDHLWLMKIWCMQ